MQRIFEHQARVGAACALAIAMVTAGTAVALGQGDAPVTLRLAVADDSSRPSFPVVEAFVEAVSDLSGESVTIEPIFDAGGDDFEVGTARLLLDGTADLAVAAGRAWAEVGVDSFEALQAPFLIDNDALAEAVADSDIARVMLDSMELQGIVGLELWPEDLRHPAIYPGCADPITTPGSFVGLNVRAIPSRVSYDLLESLGANPSFGDWDLECAQDATESGLRQGGSLPFGVVFTGDVTFFPKYQVLAANAAVFDRLTEQQRAVIRDAAAIAQDTAIATHPTDAEAAEAFCQEAGTIVLAGADGVAAFQAAAQPILDRLATDPVAAEAIEAISVLKTTTKPAPGAVACESEPTPATMIEAATGPTPIDGTYVTHLSFDELANSPLLYDAGEINDGNWGDITFEFDSGTFTFTLKNPTEDYQSSGPYNVEGDLLTMFDPEACCPPEPFSFRWSLDGDVLTLMRDPDYLGPTTYVAKPFTRIPDRSSTAASPGLQSRFPVADLPGFSGDLPPVGSFRYEVTQEDLAEAGASPGYARENAGVGTWTFSDEQATLASTGPFSSFTCTADMTSLGGERVRLVTRPGECEITLDFVWRDDGDEFYMVVVDSANLDRWTAQDWVNEQAWNDVPNARID